jgi:hypothetical protein
MAKLFRNFKTLSDPGVNYLALPTSIRVGRGITPHHRIGLYHNIYCIREDDDSAQWVGPVCLGNIFGTRGVYIVGGSVPSVVIRHLLGHPRG